EKAEYDYIQEAKSHNLSQIASAKSEVEEKYVGVIKEKDQVIEKQRKALKEQRKTLEEKDKMIEDLKRLVENSKNKKL
ncbi:MAG: hypothetical protein LBO71_09990, partial [Prevotellaceae bacterium]|nr:hypothetical protein [Prevotellaceae bacterium]